MFYNEMFYFLEFLLYFTAAADDCSYVDVDV